MNDNASVSSRPTLVLHTLPFHVNDHSPAYRLGLDLYENLTRPLKDPLAFGAGIPVFCGVGRDAVDLRAAETVVVIPVLRYSPPLLRLLSSLGIERRNVGSS